MSTFPGLILPKKKRNPKALQLTAEALAPPPPEDEDAPPLIVASDPAAAAPHNGAPLRPSPLPPTSSTASSSSSGRTRERTSSSSSSRLLSSSSSKPAGGSSSTSAASAPGGPPPGSIGKASGISRKKPAGLDISKSFTSSAAGTPTRPAPTPGSSTGEGGSGRPRRKGDHLNGHSHSSSTSSTSSPRPEREHRQAPRVSYQQKLSEQLASLDLGGGKGQTKTDLRTEDLKVVGELGSGNGGTVAKVLHGPSGLYMARKLVLIDAKPSVRKQILRELQIMHDCSSVYIVSFYGAFMADPHICICMEHMDRGSLDNIYREHGPVDIDIVGKISLAVLEGLTYLYDVHRIIHRDVKPSNILVNSLGDIKLCDFGVSGELINSIANTFVGTSTYMSPERIQGAPYTVKSDVWSLGISLIELALGRFPFSDSDADSDLSEPEPDFLERTIHSSGDPSPTSADPSADTEAVPLPPRRTKPSKPATEKKDKRKSQGVSLGGGGMTMSILDLLQHIVNEPAPKLGDPYGDESKEARFVDGCLRKDPGERLSPGELLVTSWMEEIKSKEIDLKAWAEAL